MYFIENNKSFLAESIQTLLIIHNSLLIEISNGDFSE